MTPIAAALAALALGAGALAHLGPGWPEAGALAAYAALFIPYAWLVWRLRPRTPSPCLRPAHALALLVGGALLARALVIGAPPLLSDDIYRYLWDGRVGASGINPYVWAPAAPELAWLRDPDVWPRINHRPIPTIYPPLAQLLFELNDRLGGTAWGLRGLWVLIEAGAVALAGAWLMRGESAWAPSRGLWALVIYALNPLVLIEGFASGHVDVIAWMTLALALVAFVRRPGWRGGVVAGAMLGLSVAAKLIGVIALPLLVLAPRGERAWSEVIARRGAMVVAMGLVIGALYAPYANAGSKLFTGFGAYASRWRGNDGPFRALLLTSHASLRAWAGPEHRLDLDDPDSKVIVHISALDPIYTRLGKTKTWQGRTIPDTTFAGDQLAQAAAKLVVAGLMGLLLLWCVLVIREPVAGALWLFGGLFWLAPTLYPWYVAWLAALAALRPQRAALLFTFTSLAAYLAWVSHAQGGPWHVSGWAAALEFGLVALVAWLEAGQAPALARAPAGSSSHRLGEPKSASLGPPHS